jgi:hypothetical protein
MAFVKDAIFFGIYSEFSSEAIPAIRCNLSIRRKGR